ncbi:TIR protein [Asticcacaulis biprosthecium C19]|uniref:TIR protein n=1 Tax=Asticcacaulis biprosthecium C19 TaxID=715226 RepID=F4QS66_9CAUL|nr:hypothetical protein [Asticcacaulis biprosthecium]EGF89586.1 TIR protein [Asticcacaulis biprosthecium C19]
MTSRPLPYIIALARACSLSRAWALFEAGGYLDRRDDPAALSVKGRLLKDRALRADPAERGVLLEQAAQAYLAADRYQPEPYRLINAASLYGLAGHGEESRVLAREVLVRLDGPDPIAETPYYVEATRAEAMLLLGDVPAAAMALRRAVEASPGNWSDLAGTLKQLGLICAAAGQDTSWLDPLRPPASLHFVGHMGFVAGAAGEQALARRVDRLIEDENIGFAFGALAAGADIIVAERIVAAGGVLHVFLPTAVENFARDSVDPAGPQWRARFDVLIARAHTVRSLTRHNGGHDSDATCLANEVAMGCAVLNARQMESHALQLAVLDEGGGGPHSARLAEHWRSARRRQIVEICPRDGADGPRDDMTPQPGQRRCSACLHISVEPGGDRFEQTRVLGSLIAALAGELKAGDISVSPYAWRLRFRHPQQATRWAFALRRSLEDYPGLSGQVGMACHYGVKAVMIDPASQCEVDYDLGGIDEDAVAQWLVPGSLTVSTDYLAALSVDPSVAFHAERMGEHEGDASQSIQLFALESGFSV